MTDYPSSAGQLQKAGYVVRSVKDEMRANLLSRIARRETIFPGVHGYDRTVIPAIQNAILARHDIILLGLRGQAKTRILRALASLLDERIPVCANQVVGDAWLPAGGAAPDARDQRPQPGILE